MQLNMFGVPFGNDNSGVGNLFGGDTSASERGSVQHGSYQRNPRGFDVFGRPVDPTFRMPSRSPGTSRSASRVNSPRPASRVRSANTTGDNEEHADRRSERAERRTERNEEEPVGMKQRLESIEITLRSHAQELAAVKTATYGLRSQVDSASVDMSDLVKRLDKSFADWNNKISAVEKTCGDTRTDFQPIMELFASRLDKLEEDFGTLMKTSNGVPPGMAMPSPNVQTHDIGWPAQTGQPSENEWSPLNPQRPESYGHQPRMQREATADPWSQLQHQPTHSTSYGLNMQGPSTWANGAGSNLRPFDVRDLTVDKKATHELK